MTPDISFAKHLTPLTDLHPPGVFVNVGMLGVLEAMPGTRCKKRCNYIPEIPLQTAGSYKTTFCNTYQMLRIS